MQRRSLPKSRNEMRQQVNYNQTIDAYAGLPSVTSTTQRTVPLCNPPIVYTTSAVPSCNASIIAQNTRLCNSAAQQYHTTASPVHIPVQINLHTVQSHAEVCDRDMPSASQCLHYPYNCQTHRHIQYWCSCCKKNTHAVHYHTNPMYLQPSNS